MTTIYLIRHAEAEGNLYRRVQGHWDGQVTPRGDLQIAALAERFPQNDCIVFIYFGCTTQHTGS